MTITLDVNGLSDRISSIKKLMVGRGNNTANLRGYEESKYTQCTILNFYAETDFKYYLSSRSLFEDTIVREARKQSSRKDYRGKIARTLLENRILHDTNFPLYKNLLYKEPNPKVKDKTHIEINFYTEIPKILYCTHGVSFDEEEFQAQYSPIELFVLYDLLNAIVLDVINGTEIDVLRGLLRRDATLGLVDEYIADTALRGPATVVTELMGVVTVRDVPKASYRSILSQYLCQLMLPIVTQIYKGITSLQGIVVFKSISDFRYIITTSDVNCTEFGVDIPEHMSNLTGRICPEITVIPKLYIEDEYINSVKTLVG